MYVARFTNDPQDDIERGWSGWMGVSFKSLYDAAYDLLVNGDANLDVEAIENKSDSDLDYMLSKRGYDIRFDERLGIYRKVHHEGLSCFRLEASTVEDAVNEAQAAKVEWVGDGDYTIGNVKLVCAVPGRENLYIFECDDVAVEA